VIFIHENAVLGMPVGCLIEHLNATALFHGVSQIVNADEPISEFEKFRKLMEASLPDRNSSKYMA
jgi:hypothetical protein